MTEVSVLLFDAMSQIDATFVTQRLPLLPDFRRQQCTRYRQTIDQATCIIAYLLLAKGLNDHYGLPRPEAFHYAESGKPYIPGAPVHFSLSHCPIGVVCALSSTEIGIDIQAIRPFDSKVALRVCTDAELRSLAESADPPDLFCQMWTVKESYAKARGTGVSAILRQTLPVTGFWSHKGTGYWLTAYCDDPNARFVVHTIEDIDTCI